MSVLVILLRGINVGGHNILPMKELCGLLSDMGFSEVQTYIQSGNVVVSSSRKPHVLLAQEIAAEIKNAKGFKPEVMVQSSNQLSKAIELNPFKIDDGKTLHFFFLSSKPKSPDVSLLDSVKKDTEEYKLVDNVFYLYAPDGIGRSKLVTKVEQAMGVPVTARNWNTVKKLAALAGL